MIILPYIILIAMKQQMIWLFFLAISITSKTLAENRKIDLLAAASEELVEFEVKRTREPFNQKGLKLFVSNTGKEALMVKVDAALLFEASDSNYQDLILPGNEVLYVGPGKTNSIEVQTYCAKSYAMSPDSSLAFTFKEQADSNTIKTFEYMRNIGAKADLAQQAVWFLTDQNKRLNTVFAAEQEKESILLNQFLSRLFQIPLPAYRTEQGINTASGMVARTPEILKLHVTLEWEQSSPEVLSLSIFNSRNERVASYFEDKQVRKGKGKITASFETVDYPKGEYSVRLYNDIGNVLKQIKVDLE